MYTFVVILASFQMIVFPSELGIILTLLEMPHKREAKCEEILVIICIIIITVVVFIKIV